MKKKTLTIFLHSAYWVCYFTLIPVLLALVFRLATIRTAVFSIPFVRFVLVFTILPAIISFYGFYFSVFKHLGKLQLLKAILNAVAVSILATTLTLVFVKYAGAVLNLNTNFDVLLEICIMLFILICIHGSLGLIIKGFINWYRDIKLKEELSKKNFETELELLKAKIDPHFLFNTLNNIDVLIEKDAIKASLYLNKLSEILRFMLYETKTDKILLAKEIDYIRRYIDLQKIRTANHEFISFHVSGLSTNQRIVPMILIPFIENAFKHTPTFKNGVGIEIDIKIESEELSFTCKNQINENSSVQYHNGIGNDLILKRLSLTYPNSHQVFIEKKNGIYQVNLSIQLT